MQALVCRHPFLPYTVRDAFLQSATAAAQASARDWQDRAKDLERLLKDKEAEVIELREVQVRTTAVTVNDVKWHMRVAWNCILASLLLLSAGWLVVQNELLDTIRDQKATHDQAVNQVKELQTRLDETARRQRTSETTIEHVEHERDLAERKIRELEVRAHTRMHRSGNSLLWYHGIMGAPAGCCERAEHSSR